MRKSSFAFLIATAVIATAAPAGAQSFLDRLNAKLNKLGGSTTGTPSATLAAITPAQSASIDRLLVEPIDDPAISADRAEAAPLIKILLSTGTCALQAEAWNTTNRYQLEPTTYSTNSGGGPWLAPNGSMKYHDDAKCLDAVRLTDWSKPAKNALQFRGYYLADDSGEASRQGFVLQKGSDGQWLIRDINRGDF